MFSIYILVYFLICLLVFFLLKSIFDTHIEIYLNGTFPTIQLTQINTEWTSWCIMYGFRSWRIICFTIFRKYW